MERTELTVWGRLAALLANTRHLRLRLQTLGHAAPITLCSPVTVRASTGVTAIAAIAAVATLSLLLTKGSGRSSRASV